MITAWLLAFVAAPGACPPAPLGRATTEITVIERPNSSLLHRRIEIPAGTRDDPPGREGLAVLVAAWLEAHGDDRVRAGPFVVSLSRTVETSSTSISDCPRLPDRPPLPSQQDLERLREGVLEAHERRLTDSSYVFETAVDRLGYLGKLAPAPQRPTREGLLAVQLEDLAAWLDRNYRPERVAYGSSGPVERSALEACRAAESKRPADQTAPPRPGILPVDDRGPDLVLIDQPRARPARIGLLTRTSTDAIPSVEETVAWSVLFGGRSALVNRALRETSPTTDPLLVWRAAPTMPQAASALVVPDEIPAYVDALLRELESIARLGIEEDDVELGRALAIGQSAIDWARPADALGRSMLAQRGSSMPSWLAEEAELGCLTSAQIRRAARRITDLPRLRIILVADAQPELLRALAAIRGLRRIHVLSLAQLL